MTSHLTHVGIQQCTKLAVALLKTFVLAAGIHQLNRFSGTEDLQKKDSEANDGRADSRHMHS